MKKKIISTVIAAAMLASSCAGLMPTAFAAANAPKYQEKARQMEELNRGLIAVRTTADTRGQTVNGVYLSWRLLGTESLENQAFDIYRNGKKIHTTGEHDATCYIDTEGTAADKYKVLKKGAGMMEVAREPSVTPIDSNHYAKPSEVGNGNSLKNSFTYVDIPIVRPADMKNGDGNMSYYYNLDKEHEGGANDASVGDLDGDGDYEIVLKWDPTDSKDTVKTGLSGNVYIDGYEIDPNNTGYKWRIDLGPSIRAGAHDTQFLVYDFDGDGKAEVVTQTAAGSKDSKGRYVTEVGDTEEIRNTDNTTIQLHKGHNVGPDFYTVFDGETGEAICTTAGIPLGAADGSDWEDSKFQRIHRFLAAVAYIDGVHPSIVMCRGYYNRAVLRAYTWDGTEMALQWEYDSGKSGVRDDSLYGQGNHNLSVGDIDNDGKDEIVYGSAALDDDGKTVLGNTKLGHGDAMHMSDFNNDGMQEVFSVKEDSPYFKQYAEDLRVAATGQQFWEIGKLVTTDDNGRGVMDNIDDAYALEQYNAGNKDVMAIGWSSGFANAHDFKGNDLKAKPSKAGNGSFDNFLVYWDGDLGRELLDANIIQKYDAANGWTKRFYGPSDAYTLTGGVTNNYTKRNPSLVADLWGDWREEVIMPVRKGKDEAPALRIFTSTIPTEYRLTTLMHDSQYRMSVAWQNVAYNQPTHTSYYVGSIALATDEGGNKLNYLAPAVPFTKVTYQMPDTVKVTGITFAEKSVTVEKGKTVPVSPIIEPADATKKSVTWTSSDPTVATAANGVVSGVGDGTATITATTKDGGFTASFEVTVYSSPVKGITLSDKLIELGAGYEAKLKANVTPDDASDKSVTWTSADPAIASVDADGNVKGVSYGKTTVTATTNDSGFTASCIVKVKPIDTVDLTGTDAFAFVGENTDSKTKLDASATGALLTLSDASTGATVEKTFETYKDNKAVLSFKFTTGGQKYDDVNWNWTGHEYTTGLKFLDAEGNNILTVEQPYAKSAGTLTSKIGNNEAKGLISDWTKVIDNSGYVQGSAKRWIVTLEFDYASDVCNATISGTDANWVEQGKYTKSFALNNASLKTMQLYTKQDGTGTIKANPKLESLSYSYTTTASGNAQTNIDVGTQENPMTENELDGWVQTGTDTASLRFENGRILYDPIQPAAEYNATKTFADISDDALVTYDVDWHFGSSVGRDGNFEYIQFGDNLRIGWTNGYNTFVSTDGGATWNDNDADGTADSIFTGTNTTFTKNIKVVFDTKANKIKSFTFDGKEVSAYANYALPENAAVNYITLGFQRGGAAPNWAVPNGIERIRVSQFVYGEEEPDFSSIAVTGVDGKTVNLEYTLVDYNGGSMQLIGALYDTDGKLVELNLTENMMTDDSIQHIRQGTGSLIFTNEPAEYVLKVFMWDSLNGMIPLCDTTSSVK